MLDTAIPRTPTADRVNPNWFWRGVVLGAVAGMLIGLALLFALCLTGRGEWAIMPAAVLLGAPTGAMAGAADAAFALAVVALGGRRLRARVWLAALVAGMAAAAIPLGITFHAGYPTADAGIWIGLGLSGGAFLAGVVSTPIVLGSARRRGRLRPS